MITQTLLAISAPTRLDPLKLFFDADIVVQTVMLGLILASIWVWMIIVSFSLRMRKLRAATRDYESEFWQAESFDRFMSERGNRDIPSARVAQAGVSEWRRSVKGEIRDREGVRGRIANAMESQIAQEADDISERLNFLATVGSVAPFVGLFGTVWGIMNSFFQIGAQESSSLAVVAPGISEALFATAIGLFAAIPAVIAYNRFSNDVDRFESKLGRFSDKLNASFSRQLEQR
ncbi:protein TolQ [Qipengyuania sp. 1NDW9]|uniref:Protein TolQ n=1 Tax=Qipengyuania xiapuensis TaxID=2867236 RepID=A0ABX8ZSR4_9SPHN|nr:MULTISPECIES: protein TolQ [Qipengyuania]MBX7493966.1 protein TolQ [Qipengyuania xiapuensis]MBY6129651.1 protein TolQ [Qipengyuania aquimaris]QZD91944.1 protein TolQ [Qipengyuania xiapuensis]